VNRPQSLNRWGYVEGNPVNLTDPSGYNPNCVHPWLSFCAYQRLGEIIKENGNNGAEALISVFTDPELQNLWGDYSGNTSAKRLEWLLEVTLGDAGSYSLDFGTKVRPLNIHLQFGLLFNTDCLTNSRSSDCGCGLASEFEDSQFYIEPVWGEQISRQINHFLSGVGEYYYGKDIRIIIAHEKSTDRNKWDNFFSEVTLRDRLLFYEAWEYDKKGLYPDRDDMLWSILNFSDSVSFGSVDPNRRGNSLQDFRLSLRAVRFSDWVMSNSESSPGQAGNWLSSNMLP
jgi:hypothetical protein